MKSSKVSNIDLSKPPPFDYVAELQRSKKRNEWEPREFLPREDTAGNIPSSELLDHGQRLSPNAGRPTSSPPEAQYTGWQPADPVRSSGRDETERSGVTNGALPE